MSALGQEDQELGQPPEGAQNDGQQPPPTTEEGSGPAIELDDGNISVEEIDPILDGTEHGLRLNWIHEGMMNRGDTKALVCYNHVDTDGDGTMDNPGFSVLFSCVHADQCETYQIMTFIWGSQLENEESPQFGGTFTDYSGNSNSGPEDGILSPNYTSRWSFNTDTYNALGFGYEDSDWHCWWNNESPVDATGIVALGVEGAQPIDLCQDGWESNSDWCSDAPAEEDAEVTAVETNDEVEDNNDEAEQEGEETTDEVEQEAVETTDEVEQEGEETIDEIETEGEEVTEDIEDAVDLPEEEPSDETQQETEEAVDETAQETEEAIDETAQETEEAVDETEEAVDETQQETEEAVDETAQETEEAVDEAQQETEETTEEVTDEVTETTDETGEAIDETVGGILIGESP